MTALHRWRESDVVWGVTYCQIPHCFTAADGLWEHEQGAGVPVCVTHADLLLERTQAAGIAPGAPLPDLWEQKPPWRPPVERPETWGRSPELWLAEQFGADPSDTDWDIPF